MYLPIRLHRVTFYGLLNGYLLLLLLMLTTVSPVSFSIHRRRPSILYTTFILLYYYSVKREKFSPCLLHMVKYGHTFRVVYSFFFLFPFARSYTFLYTSLLALSLSLSLHTRTRRQGKITSYWMAGLLFAHRHVQSLGKMTSSLQSLLFYDSLSISFIHNHSHDHDQCIQSRNGIFLSPLLIPTLKIRNISGHIFIFFFFFFFVLANIQWHTIQCG